MGPNETSAAGNQDALAISWGQQFDGWETREGGVGDSLGVWVVDRLGLVGRETLGEPRMQFSLLYILLRVIGAARGSQDIMRSKIKRSEEIDGNFTVEAETTETDCLDFLTRLVQDPDLSRSKRVRKFKRIISQHPGIGG